MTTNKCKKCGILISPGVRLCPDCTPNNKTGFGCLGKTIYIFIILGILAYLSPKQSETLHCGVKVLNVRNRPGINHEIIGTLKKFDRIIVDKEEDGWAYFTNMKFANGGWVIKKFLIDVEQSKILVRKEKEAKIKQDNIDYFNSNRLQVISNINKLTKEKNFEKALLIVNKYLATRDIELLNMYDKIKDDILRIQKEQKLVAKRQKRIDSQFHPWDGAHINFERYIKRSMNDPNSYEHVETRYWDMGDHLIVSTTYRGKNAFGGIVEVWMKAKVSLDGQILNIFK